MVIVCEFDKNWTVGIDWLDDVKGIRLGWFAIHAVSGTLSDFTRIMSQVHESMNQEGS